MSKSSTGSVRRWIGGAVLVAALTSVVSATITDDITPFGSQVSVGLLNASPNAKAGTVSVTVVQANGQKATRTVPFSVDAEGRTSVTALFFSQVAEVVAVSIAEN
jgi:hypothetical protein